MNPIICTTINAFHEFNSFKYKVKRSFKK